MWNASVVYSCRALGQKAKAEKALGVRKSTPPLHGRNEELVSRKVDFRPTPQKERKYVTEVGLTSTRSRDHRLAERNLTRSLSRATAVTAPLPALAPPPLLPRVAAARAATHPCRASLLPQAGALPLPERGRRRGALPCAADAAPASPLSLSSSLPFFSPSAALVHSASRLVRRWSVRVLPHPAAGPPSRRPPPRPAAGPPSSSRCGWPPFSSPGRSRRREPLSAVGCCWRSLLAGVVASRRRSRRPPMVAPPLAPPISATFSPLSASLFLSLLSLSFFSLPVALSL
ncbi:hypothetical protein Scep_014024 [Stephania cephalantha]|uniref:Uncharacterized protein n=1 Tax=Stephania cephalantha TaxID=152367 RepID=A0AAP0J2B2_9MAGN